MCEPKVYDLVDAISCAEDVVMRQNPQDELIAHLKIKDDDERRDVWNNRLLSYVGDMSAADLFKDSKALVAALEGYLVDLRAKMIC